jgi:hypothetical protein
MQPVGMVNRRNKQTHFAHPDEDGDRPWESSVALNTQDTVVRIIGVVNRRYSSPDRLHLRSLHFQMRAEWSYGYGHRSTQSSIATRCPSPSSIPTITANVHNRD